MLTTASDACQIFAARARIVSGTQFRLNVSIREAMLTRFAESTLNGDVKAAAFLLQRYDMSGTVNEDATDSAMQDDLEIIKAFFEDPNSKGELK
jgi:hypothetical protein